jgi:hypothetical protein
MASARHRASGNRRKRILSQARTRPEAISDGAEDGVGGIAGAAFEVLMPE